MEFKQLDIKPEGSWIKRNILSQHGKKTITYMVIGAVVGFIFFFITEEKQFATLTSGEIIKSMAMGGFFGFFITNSPCARGKC